MIPSYSPLQTSCARSNGAYPLSIKPLSLSIDSFIQKLKRNHYENWPILTFKNSYCLLRFVPKNEFKILIIIAQFALFFQQFFSQLCFLLLVSFFFVCFFLILFYNECGCVCQWIISLLTETKDEKRYRMSRTGGEMGRGRCEFRKVGSNRVNGVGWVRVAAPVNSEPGNQTFTLISIRSFVCARPRRGGGFVQPWEFPADRNET